MFFAITFSSLFFIQIMIVAFQKYHSMYNSIVFFYNPYRSYIPIHLISNHYRGIGFDQTFILNGRSNITIYNSDGSTSENCLNGMKCFAHFMASYTLRYVNKIRYSNNSYYLVSKNQSNKVSLFNIHHSFLLRDCQISFIEFSFFFCVYKKFLYTHYLSILSFVLVSIRNPHMILLHGPSDLLHVNNLIKKQFPYGINISLYNSGSIKTLERGAGYTNSCGSATSSVGILYNLLKRRRFSYIRYNETVHISWGGSNIFSVKPITLFGYANKICEGLL